MKNRQNYFLSCIFYLFVGGLFTTAISFAIGHPTFSRSRVAASAPAEKHPPASIYAVSSNTLAIEIAAPEVTLARQLPYVPQPGDETIVRRGRSHIKRNGQPLGLLVGPEQKTLYTYDQAAETAFRRGAADSTGSYAIASRNDPHYAFTQSPTQVFRKSKPVALSRESDGERHWPAAHTLYLTLPRPMVAGKTYRLSFPGLGVEDDVFTYEPATARSEAVHVSQIGFRPTDNFKAGYLSTWMGNGGGLHYPENLEFSLVEAQSDRIAYKGQAVLRRRENQIEDPLNRDYTRSEVHQLDFSDFTQPGQYRLCVEGVGCSFAFDIRSDVWQQAFYTSVRGFYHQRSGIAIGTPHSDFTRPRAFHPADGVEVYQSTATLLESNMGLGKADAFKVLLAGKTDVTVPDAWGGYFDAADWDRRIQHLTVPHRLLELYILFPDYFGRTDLDLPESDNTLPDIIDEALWSLDFFRRLQTPDGGIRGGIESADHPNWGEASWQESLAVMAYAPDVWSSYVYAGAAARAAYALRVADSQRPDSQISSLYRDSAVRAMAYAESRYAAGEGINDATDSKRHQIDDHRNLAALELYRATGEQRWHDLFLETTIFTDAAADVYVHGQQDQGDAAFLYASLEDGLAVNESVRTHARAALLRRADEQVTLTKTSAFGWSRRAPKAPVGWRSGLGAPSSLAILRAHALTDDADYLRAGISGTQFAVGANPNNMVFTTGMGDRSPQNPLIIDQRITGQAPPPGITLFGPADFDHYKDYWLLDMLAPVTFPNIRQWPTAENYFDIYSNPIGAEFTVHYMASATYTWGYLAARAE